MVKVSNISSQRDLTSVEDRLLLGVDIGATGIKVNVFDAKSNSLLLKESLRVLTEADSGPEQASWKIAKLAHHAVKELELSVKDIEAVGIATPGPCDYQFGVYLSSPNLPSWDGFDMKSSLEKLLSLPSYFLNDGSAAALAEKNLGVGADKESLFLFTVGSGIGGGFADDSGLFVGSGEFSRYSTELGHCLVADPYDPAARICGCGAKGHLEAYASFGALIKMVEQGKANSPTLFDLSAWDGCAEKGEFMVVEANRGDKFFCSIFEQGAQYLAAGAVSVSNSFAPEVIAVGGGASALGDFYFDAVRAAFALLVPESWAEQRKIPVLRAMLGNDAGVIGAALYAGAKK